MQINKPIIATTLSGLFISPDPWNRAHKIWFEEMAIKLNDLSIKELAEKEDYFKFVDDIMKRLYPNLSDEERTTKARKEYFKYVVKLIMENLEDYVRNDVVDYFLSIKDSFRIALITTNTPEALSQILEVAELLDLFDIIEFSLPEEKDDKIKVFDNFIEKNSKPILYIGGDRKSSYDYCKANNIKSIFANFDLEEEINGVESVHNLEELKEIIEDL